ncbi:MAG: hypothetical protein CVU88_02870 [Firmicutes bacterium HGW-Firmicutes-13]|nr:MAG: hypothetical protein CVU88_02870 [Firmicutes bacterium HGW-Firmicutes-13]
MLLDDKRGISFLETLMVLSLISMVLVLGYSFYAFGARIFAIGESQTNMQRDIRLAADFITREVRNSRSLSLMDFLDSPIKENFYYIYLEHNCIKHIDQDGMESRKTDAVIEELIFELKEVPEANNRVLLRFKITGKDGEQDYILESEVLLNNISSLSPISDMSVVRYKKS